jgi:integrase/recombinase XerD
MKTEKGKAKVLTKSEWNRVLKYQSNKSLSRHGLRNTLLLHLSFYLGLSSKEMASLLVSDLVDVNGDFKEEVTLKWNQKKGNKRRRFYLTNKQLLKVLNEYLDTRRNADGELNLNKILITNQMSGKFSPNSLQQLFHRIYKSLGIIGASSHSGRRHYATKMAEGGVSITNLQTLMGHQNISTTSLYINENSKILGKITADYSV